MAYVANYRGDIVNGAAFTAAERTPNLVLCVRDARTDH
jgi:3-deoxy-D-arabino-heptulosonate 7-phosphate (DAHP) synthase class II